jgi:hypothetical protein
MNRTEQRGPVAARSARELLFFLWTTGRLVQSQSAISQILLFVVTKNVTKN